MFYWRNLLLRIGYMDNMQSCFGVCLPDSVCGNLLVAQSIPYQRILSHTPYERSITLSVVEQKNVAFQEL